MAAAGVNVISGGAGMFSLLFIVIGNIISAAAVCVLPRLSCFSIGEGRARKKGAESSLFGPCVNLQIRDGNEGLCKRARNTLSGRLGTRVVCV